MITDEPTKEVRAKQIQEAKRRLGEIKKGHPVYASQHRDVFFDTFWEVRASGADDKPLVTIRTFFPAFCKEYLEVCKLCVDTDEPWTSFSTFLRVYNYMYGESMTEENSAPSGIRNTMYGQTVRLKRLFPHKEFSQQLLERIGLG